MILSCKFDGPLYRNCSTFTAVKNFKLSVANIHLLVVNKKSKMQVFPQPRSNINHCRCCTLDAAPLIPVLSLPLYRWVLSMNYSDCLAQLCHRGRGVPVDEERVPGPVCAHFGRVRGRQDGGLQENPAIHRGVEHTLDGRGTGEGPPAAVQPYPGGQCSAPGSADTHIIQWCQPAVKLRNFRLKRPLS